MLNFEHAVLVQDVKVITGDHVKKGDTIATLYRSELDKTTIERLADINQLEVERNAKTETLSKDRDVILARQTARISELQAMAGLFVTTAKLIAAAIPNARFVTPLVNRETRALFEAAVRREPGLHIQLLDGKSHDAIAAADVVLVASGTATLETALLQRPMVITYRMPWLSAWIMKRRGYLPYVGLPNILAGEFVVPELLQDAATPEALSRAVLDLLNDAPRRQRISERFSRMLLDLRQNTAQKAADAVMPYLEQRS